LPLLWSSGLARWHLGDGLHDRRRDFPGQKLHPLRYDYLLLLGVLLASADPLAERPEKLRGVEILASVATLTPNAAPTSENPQFQGGDGEFGDGGASGGF
jgi:hypothetical protein